MYYFDNAATTFPKPDIVYSSMDKFYREYGVNIGRGQYPLANNGSILLDETRKLLLDLFHSQNKKVIFSSSATEGINIILQGIEWKDGMTVYMSPFEHNAVTRTLNYIRKLFQINIVQLCVNKESIDFDIEKIKYQFQDEKPDVLVISHASNVCGLIAPVKEIFGLAKQYKAITVLDMAQTAGLLDINLNDCFVDYAIFAGHKTLYGPFGIAGIICDEKSKLTPLMYGGTGTESANQEMPINIPSRFEVGSLNIHAISGLNSALKWINMVGIEKIFQCEQNSLKKLHSMLSKFNNIKIVGMNDITKHVGVVSCVFDGFSSNEIGKILGEDDIAVRTGLHCSPSAHIFLGTFPSGTVRISIGYFNSDDDFNKLEEVLEYIEENS